uniref:Uncharacterized protein n=1 Tax=Salix viminalis TaxID=40686 RepID=A0A6N2LJA1_SALVM
MPCFWEHGDATTKTWVLGGGQQWILQWRQDFMSKTLRSENTCFCSKRRELNLIALNVHGVSCLSFKHADLLPPSSNKTALINGFQSRSLKASHRPNWILEYLRYSSIASTLESLGN